MSIGETILQQLGGRKFIALTGASNFIGHANGLSFRLPGKGGFTREGINYVKITLNGQDLYDVEFARIWGRKMTFVAQETNIYADGLKDVIRLHTGLVLDFPKVVGVNA